MSKKSKKVVFRIAFAAMLLTLPLLILFHKSGKAWGFYAHKSINRLAVYTLPPEMIGFYKKHIEYITEHAIDPDKRRYATEGEAPRHYIDIDHYGEYPFDNVPRKWDDAVAALSEDTLNAYGIVPWHLEKMVGRLTKAFEARNSKQILRLSADLGHYVGDGHVPLHTTTNYNGQLTNQKGIHGFWESRIPELFGDNYDFWVGKAEYVLNPNEYIWDFILESHVAVDTVLLFERQLTERFPSDQKYCYENRGSLTMRTYCEGFSKAYEEMLGGMIERRMRGAIITTGSFWFTAWVNAGQPDLDMLDIELSKADVEEQEKLEQEYLKGNIKGREHDK